MDSWEPRSDQQFAFFFEDDIEVSRDYFTYSLLCIRKYVYPDGKRATNQLAEHLVGVSLNTPRYNEIILPPQNWVPTDAIGHEANQFLFQLPCSWGALYFPWAWREFREFYAWRKSITLPKHYQVVPRSATNLWERSWKRYLVELMFIRGQVMVYPALERQLSFSTHHREPGEHTSGTAQENLVDELGTHYLEYFTVPLANDREVTMRLFAHMAPLKDLPLVSFYHTPVKNWYELAQQGIWAEEMLQGYGYSMAHLNPNPGCILDLVSYPIPKANANEERFLLYSPQGSLTDQLSAFEAGLAYSRLLNRTLLVPPLLLRGNAEAPLSRLLDWRLLEGPDAPKSNKSEWQPAPFRNLTSMSTGAIWIDRLIDLEPLNLDVPTVKDDSILESRGITPLTRVTIPTIRGHDLDIQRMFGGCQEKFLSFRSLSGAFYSHNSTTLDTSFRQWIDDHVALNWTMREFVKWRKQELGENYAVLTFSRGGKGDKCGYNQQDYYGIDRNLIVFRNCKAGLVRSIEYVQEYASRANVTLSAIYVHQEHLDPSDPAPREFGPSKLPIMSTTRLTAKLAEARLATGEFANLGSELTQLMEVDMATRATLYLGNFYSELSKWIVKRRRSVGKTSEILAIGAVTL